MTKEAGKRAGSKAKNEAKKKQSYIIAVFFVIWGITMLTALIVYSHIKTSKTPQLFNPEKKNSAAKLYEDIMKYDLERNYPDSPEIVMEIYNDTIRIIYGDMIIDETVLFQVVEHQRKLLSPDLLKENPVEGQLEALTNSLEELKEMKIYCIDASQREPIYDRYNSSKCTIETTQIFKNLDDVNRDYYFVKNPQNGRWQIDDWGMNMEN